VGILARCIAGRLRRHAAMLVLVLGLLTGAYGCGETHPAVSDRSAHRETAPDPVVAVHTSRQLARAVLLRLGDLNSEWRQARPTAPAPCRARTGWERASAIAASPSFQRKFGSVQQNVAVFASDRMAARVLVALESREAQRCFYRALLLGVRTNAGKRSTTRPTVVMTDDEAATRATRSLVRTDSIMGPVAVYADQVRMKVGRVLSVMVLIDIGQPFEEALYANVLKTIRTRTAGVLGAHSG
jgi:hypothetical protein